MQFTVRKNAAVAGVVGRNCRRQLLCPSANTAGQKARNRGTSVYFPSQVIPMLPKCSLTACARSTRM